jgi:hypothetical protein
MMLACKEYSKPGIKVYKCKTYFAFKFKREMLK